MRLSMLLTAGLTLASTASAAEPLTHYTTLGPLPSSCGTWTAVRDNRQSTAMAYEQWILGFLSGIGSTGSSYGLNPLNGITDANAVWGWMDNYCREHPLDNIAAAGEAFLKAHPN